MKPPTAVTTVLALALGIASPAQETKLPDLAAAYLAAPPAKQKMLAATLLALKPTPDALAAALAKGPVHNPDQAVGWVQGSNPCLDGVKRPWVLYVPEDYDATKAYPLLVDLHGGVSQPRALPHQRLIGMARFFWGGFARSNKYLLLVPSGDVKAPWWSKTGAHNVLSLLALVRGRYHVDVNRVYATGFSDGASGGFYLALTHATPFAGFVHLNGHVAVAAVGGLQVHLYNLVNKPRYIVNTEKDSLYPSASVVPFIKALQAWKAPLVWRDLPNLTHNPMYIPREQPAIGEWMKTVKRNPHPKRLVWQGTAKAPGRIHWLEVAGVGTAKANFTDPNPMMPPRRPRLGVTLGRADSGGGVKIATVADKSAAQAAGVQPGDVITRFGDKALGGLQDLRRALRTVRAGGPFSLTVERQGDPVVLKGSFPEGKPYPAFRRLAPAGSIEASIAANTVTITAANITRIRLYLAAELVGFGKPVKVIVNGRTLHDGSVAQDAAFMLQQAGRDRDPSMLYRARLDLAIPAAKPPQKKAL